MDVYGDRFAEAVNIEWDAERLERARKGMHRRRKQRARRKAAVAATCGAACVWLALMQGAAPEAPAVASVQSVAITAPLLPELQTLHDGSRLAGLSEAPRYEVVREAADETRIALRDGAVRFGVTRNPGRGFHVDAGEVHVRVLGTVFDVSADEREVRVFVVGGRVEVTHPGGQRVLTRGQSLLVSRTRATGPAPEPVAAVSDEGPAADLSATPPVARKQRTRWQEHARKGEFDKAFEIIHEREQSVRETLDELLLAADAARLSGHPAEAIPYLEKAIEHFPDDPRSQLAAFMVGRIRLTKLGEPAKAAEAFARVQRTATRKSLVEDAAIRRIEALHRAGARSEAARLAREYLDAYPDTTRRARVERYLQ